VLKASKVYLPATYTSRSQFPDYLWVEGISVSSSLRDVTLALEYTIGGKVFDDKINLTVVQVDLDMSGVSDSEETYKGGFIALNDDDDDTQVDKDDGTVAGEIDLMGIHLNILPSLTIGQVKLEATDGSSKIDLWDGINKGPGHHITLPKTWDLSSESLPAATWGVEGINTSSSLRDVELKLSYIKDSSTIHSDIVKFTIIDVDFVEDTSQIYGFDNYTYCPTYTFFPQKSVRVSKSDTAKAQIEGSGLASSVYFLSSNTSEVTVSPSQASSSPQTVTFTGIAEGFTTVWSKLNSAGPYGANAAVIGVAPYVKDGYTLAVRVVHEDDDDVQVIAPGASGSSTTSICVSPGPNGKRDTIKGGDDVYSGEDILVGPNKICDTTADNTDDMSTDPYSASELEGFLNNIIYNQAVVKWTVMKFSDMTVNFDLNNDGKLDVSSWTTSEENEIINACDPGESFDVVVFIVNNPSNSSYAGGSYPNQKYAFVFPDISPDETETTAHEIGHAKFGLPDLSYPDSSDTYNLMWWAQEYSFGWKLRKGQWDVIQSKQTH